MGSARRSRETSCGSPACPTYGSRPTGPEMLHDDAVEAPTALAAYPTHGGFYDEAFEPDGAARAHYQGLLTGLHGVDLEELRQTVAADLRSRGVSFQGAFG